MRVLHHISQVRHPTLKELLCKIGLVCTKIEEGRSNQQMMGQTHLDFRAHSTTYDPYDLQ